MIQPVVKLVEQPIEQPAASCKNKHSTGCRTGCQPVDNRLITGWMFVYTMQPVLQLVVNPVEQQVVCLHDVNGWMLGCMNQIGWIHTTGWTTGWMFVYTIQPVVQPVTTGCETGL